MKNISMKKIYSYAFATLVVASFMMLVPSARAASFNDSSIPGTNTMDCPVVMVSAQTGIAPAHTCFPRSTSVVGSSAFTVALNYHNTGTDTANNVVLRLSPQTASAVSSQSFTGSISASNSAQAVGNASINFSIPSNVTFNSATWYPDQGGASGSVSRSFPNGQSGAEIFGNGLNIGNVLGYTDSQCLITNGVRNAFCHEGWVMLTFSTSQVVSPACTVSLTASPMSVQSGNATQITWSSTNGCTNVNVSGTNGFSAAGLTGTQSSGALTQDTTFTVTGNSLIAAAAPQSRYVTVVNNPVCTLSMNPSSTTVSYGASTTLTWSSNGNCNGVTVSGPQGTIGWGSSGTVSTGPLTNSSNMFTVQGTRADGTPVSTVTYVSVNQNNTTACTGDFVPAQTQVVAGGTTTINWWTSGCNSVSVTGPNGFISSSATGVITTAPLWGNNASATYTLTGYGTYGSNNLNKTVTIYSYNNNLTNTPPSVTTNSATSITNTSASFNGYISNNTGIVGCSFYYSCGSNGTYYFLYGTSQYNLNNQTPVQTMNSASSAVTAYVTNLLPNTTYYFELVGTNSYGTNYGSALSFVTTGGSSSSFAAITSLATNVASYSVRLNGLVIAGQQYSTGTAYFEYGTSQALGRQTVSQTLSTVTATNYFDTITTSPNTTYYYRIVALSGGMQYSGSIISFTTPGVNDSTPVVVTKYVTGTGGGSSYVSLSITDQFQTVAPGDAITYTVNYQNISKSTLSNAVLNVILPTGVTFKQASQGMLTTNNNPLANISFLRPKKSASKPANSVDITLPSSTAATMTDN